MKNLTRRSLSLLLALAMCLSLLTGITLTASAATVEYRYGSTSQYSNCSNVIYNWGSRGTTATFLSPNAEAFYQSNNTSYSALSALSGSSTESAVPSSALFQELRTLMTENHTYINSYDATRDMFAFTDCQNSALTSTKISSFYSGAQIGPGWDSGSTWNREHTWPNSKGDANGNGENDIMMLRPASSSENSGRNNTAYGQSSSYYDPNSASGGSYDLRGDVARIVLYVYVRWQNTTDSAAVLFGTDGVIESKDVLLSWMEADPVDTWELGRNDSVESITGTRNVFVDYPELGFLLFNESVPADYQSPSNSTGDSGSTENVTVSFMENGKQTLSYTIPAGQSVEMPASTVTPDEGYSFAGWVTDSLEETATRPANVYATGSNYSAAEQTFYALYTRVDTSAGSGNIYSKYSGTITEGDYVIAYTDTLGNGALVAADANSDGRLDYLNITVSDDILSNPDSSIVWHIAPSGSYYTLYNAANSGYAGGTTVNNKAAILTSVDNYAKWTVSGTETYEFVNAGNSRYLRKNTSYGYACYSSSTGGALTLYKATTGTTYYSTVFGNVCAHANTTTNTVDATCTADGSTTVTCSGCGEILSTTVLTATGHDYNAVVTAPTATAQGYTTYTCAACGDSYVSDYIPALGQDHTVSFSVPTGVSSVTSMTGNSSGITLPTAGAPDGYTFAGWTIQPLEETTEAPDILTGTYIPTEDTTLYALYTREEISGEGSGDYEKVTAAPSDWSGEYLIVYEDGSCVLNGSLTKLDAAANNAAVTITDNTIAASEADAYRFTIAAVTDGYSIQSVSGYYIGATGNSNSLNTSTSTVYTNTLSVNTDGSTDVIGSGGAYLRFNSASNQLRFRYYKSSTYTGQKAIALYKKSTGSTTTYYTTLTVQASAAVYQDGQEYCAYSTLAEAVANCGSGQYVKLLADVQESLTITADLYLDLNGFDVNGTVTVTSGTLYGMDSVTDDYDCSDDYGKIATVVGSYAANFKTQVTGEILRYLAVNEDGAISFHRIYLGISSVCLKPGIVGFGYKAVFGGDEKAQALLGTDEAFGYSLWLDGSETTVTRSKGAGDFETGKFVTMGLKNIDVENYGATPICANVYLKLTDGTVITSETYSYSLQEMVQKVDAALTADENSYSETQIAAVKQLYQTYATVMEDWGLEYINQA